MISIRAMHISDIPETEREKYVIDKRGYAVFLKTATDFVEQKEKLNASNQ